MAEGRTNAAIARRLVVTDRAIEKHVASIFGKLGLPRARRTTGGCSPCSPGSTRSRVRLVLKALFWVSAGALAWTHVGYPLAAAALARRRPRPVRKEDVTPSVTVVVAAHDEEDVIGRRIENLLALDYPPDRLEVVVASDDSGDGTDRAVEAVAERDAAGALGTAPARGEDSRAGRRRRRVDQRDRRLLGRQLDLGAGRSSQARPQLRRRRRRLRLRPARARAAGRREPRAPVLALRALGAGERVRAGRHHCRKRRHLRRAPGGLPQERSTPRVTTSASPT